MIKLIKKTSDKIGIDGAIAFTILSRIIQAGGGVVTLILIAKCLTKVEQGYYYTFGSILGIQIFFELGLSSIIILYVAHENSNLTWNDKISFIGPEESSSRLSSLLRFAVKWFSVLSIVILLVLIITGIVFFSKFGSDDVGVNWSIPWMIMSIFTSLSLLTSPIMAFFEGLGKVKDIAKIRMVQQALQLVLTISLFFFGFKLYSTPIASIISFSVIPLWIFFTDNRKTLQFIWNKLDKWRVNYSLEIFPYQWKMALSFISFYFIYQLFNPVLFATEGAVVAGQMGMTLTVLNTIFTIAYSWVSTKSPIIANLIAQKKYVELDELFKKVQIQSIFISGLGLLAVLLAVFLLRYVEVKIEGKSVGDRFLPYQPMIFMMISIFLNQIAACWTSYLRAHKKEPMLVNSIVMAICCSISTIYIGKYFGVFGMTLGYMILTCVSFVWTYYIFKSKKKEYQEII